MKHPRRAELRAQIDELHEVIARLRTSAADDASQMEELQADRLSLADGYHKRGKMLRQLRSLYDARGLEIEQLQTENAELRHAVEAALLGQFTKLRLA